MTAPESPDAELRIVALVCSAGGFSALVSVLAPLPASFPAAVIVLRHQAPDHSSPLVELLGRKCALPVTAAQDGADLRAGTVCVVPPGKHALVTVDRRIALIKSDVPPPYRPSADLLLTSLALVAPRQTIAVILSGAGKDGATGATAIHDFGGVVIAADRASSEYFGMPEAAIGRDDAVDYILPVTQIADRLETLVGEPVPS